MAEAEVRAFVIKKTQESLGRFIKRPPLTEKLLRKPPFRFLHDIVTAVIRQHGLMDGLFTADEMISDNVKDKERKIAFLQKVIDTMRLVTGAQLNVRPSKIVAGQEAERTNELLQAIGKALERKLSSTKAVEQVLAASAGPSDPAAEPVTQPTESAAITKAEKSSKTSKSKTKEKPKEEVQVNGKPRRSKQGSESKSKETGKQGSESKSSKQDGEAKSRREKKNREEKAVEPEIFGEVVPVNPSAPELTPDSSLPPQSLPDSTGVLENTHQSEEAQSLDPALTALNATELPQLGTEESSTVLGSSGEPPQNSATEDRAPSTTPSRVPTAIVAAPRPPSVRPGSARPRPLTARPAAPRLKERLVRPAREEHTSPVTAEPPSNLIPDTSNAAKDDEEDATFVVEETAAPQETVNNGAVSTTLDPALVPENAGHLVSQILGAQRELEPQRDALGQEETSGWHSGETWRHSEVTRLREAVQGLVRAANPLGRLLDFLQEDVEAMQLELETWQAENQELRAHIAREARATAESMAPLERELAALEVQAEQQRVALTSLKTVVLANEKRLTEMLLKL